MPFHTIRKTSGSTRNHDMGPEVTRKEDEEKMRAIMGKLGVQMPSAPSGRAEPTQQEQLAKIAEARGPPLGVQGAHGKSRC